MKRRNFIKSLLALPALATLNRGLIPTARAASTNATLLVVFQRGGCDGLNTIVPFGDPDYRQLRPNIGIAEPDTLNAASAIDLNGFFGLHPAMAALAPIYASGQLAIMPATHYDNSSHSHFDSQARIEAGANGAYDGWLNRYLTATTSGGDFQGVAFGTQTPASMRGPAPVSTIATLGSSGGLPAGYETQLQENLLAVNSQSVLAEEVNRARLHQSGLTALDVMAISASFDVDNYIPQYGATYPDSSFGRHMAQAAQLIKAGLGTDIITVDIGGWDTHANQGGGDANGQQASRLADFAEGLAAFHYDMTDYRNQVMVSTMTEFGRTAKENASFGTDHGNASAWMAMGNLEGSIYGDWPGLTSDDLVGGRFLAHSIDHRDIMAELLSYHLGVSDLATLLPGHSYTPVGFLAG
ncbi:MAG: DUF1501 domain-containing protein [Gammaproteobacteria bacterium]|nr:DUF1501 domain-containing protein [Gammaproteobacteria bacterium]